MAKIEDDSRTKFEVCGCAVKFFFAKHKIVQKNSIFTRLANNSRKNAETQQSVQPTKPPSISMTVVSGRGPVTEDDRPRWACPFCILFFLSMVWTRAATLCPYLACSKFVVASTAIPVAFTLGFLAGSPLR